MQVRNPRGKKVEVRETLVDRVVNYFNPIAGKLRLHARAMSASAGGYDSGSRRKRPMRNFTGTNNDADGDILPDLALTRERSRDQERNNPIATGAINTAVTNVVGTGLKPQPNINAAFLGLSDDAANDWELNTLREFLFWANSTECDSARTLNFFQQQDLAFRSVLSNGDALYTLPMFERKGSPYLTKMMAIETDRLTNKNNAADNNRLAGGVELDSHGAPVNYHIMTQHPGSFGGGKREWVIVRAFGQRSGRRNVLHLFDQKRPGQRRGVPYLAPVLESLKQLSRYTEAELMAAVVSGMFTVFVKSETGESNLGLPNGEETDSGSPDDYELGNGSIIGLAEDESIETADPGRPNPNFDPFFVSIMRQIGMALEIPFEILMKHFTASYSASRAAFLEAWRFYNKRRVWLAAVFCQPVYETWLAEAVSSGRISAPGFFSDESIRAAYSGCNWNGDAPGHIDEKKAIDAAEKRINVGVSHIDRESLMFNGSDFESNHRQRVKENDARTKDGLLVDKIVEPQGETDGLGS